MSMSLSKTQIDKLGERLKKGDITEDNLRLLDAYRRSFSEAYEFVVGAIRNELGLEPTGRPAKSTTSIADKLRRESIRLTQIQDIAGCRLIVAGVTEQERTVQSLTSLFERAVIVDRRQKPSHGYRAVHVIVTHLSKMVEIQVRTSPQHLWAELSEKFSDVNDPAIKYGGGDKTIQDLLISLSSLVASYESLEEIIADHQANSTTDEAFTEEEKREFDSAVKIQEELRSLLPRILNKLNSSVEKLRIGKVEE